MKERIKELKYCIEDRLRQLCGEITPEKRVTVIVISFLLMAFANLYIIFKSIYDIGKNDGKKEAIEIKHIQPLSLNKKSTDSLLLKP